MRLQLFLTREDALEQICDNIASGGSVPSIAKVLDVPPGKITRWLRSDPERTKRYEAALTDRDEWEHEQVLHQLRSIGNFDVRSLYTDEGQLKPVSEWPEEAAVAVAGVEISDIYEGKEHVGFTKKVKLLDRIKALDLSGKQLGMFKEQKVHTGHVTLEQLVFGDVYDDEPEGDHH